MPSNAALQQDLLLSRDLQDGDVTRRDGAVPAQLALPGFDATPVRLPRQQRHTIQGRQPARPAEDALIASFLRRLAAQGRARKGQRAYEYQIRSMLLVATRLTGRPTSVGDLFRDGRLLGQVLLDDTAPTLGTRLSRWTLAQRRSAIRAFATLMRPELAILLAGDPHDHLDRALRGVAERVGTGYRLNGGTPRRRGGRAPTVGQISDVLDAVGQAAGFVGPRNRAFFQILGETGARLNALRQLDGTNCVEMPNGRLRLFLHEKGKGEPREVELGHDAATALRAYTGAFNYHAAVRRWAARVRLGEPGPVWRNSPHGCWSASSVRATLRAGCAAAEVVPFTPHAFRRAFASDAASVLPRATVARAGGWRGLERLDDHYVQPRGAVIRGKLGQICRASPDREPSLGASDEPTVAV